MAELRKILMEDIISNIDRKEGGLGDIKKLAESIKSVGLINPITVRQGKWENIEGEAKKNRPFFYAVIAGRRRFLAVQSLGLKEIEAVVYTEDEPIEGEEIALAENVNRMDLHPLDEGEKYKELIKAGKSIEDLSKTFDRSPATIYQRVKLCDLHYGIKRLFREGRVTITQAAKIASVPKAVQDSILNKIDKPYSASDWEINTTIRRSIKQVLNFDCEKCKTCTKRTWYSNNNLFPELNGEQDFCLDEKCYEKMQAQAVEKTIREFVEAAEYTGELYVAAYDAYDDEQDKMLAGIIQRIKPIEGITLTVFSCDNPQVQVLDDAEAEVLDETERPLAVLSVFGNAAGKADAALAYEDYERIFNEKNKPALYTLKEDEKVIIEKLPEECKAFAVATAEKQRRLLYINEINTIFKTCVLRILKEKYEKKEAFIGTKLIKKISSFHTGSFVDIFNIITGSWATEETIEKAIEARAAKIEKTFGSVRYGLDIFSGVLILDFLNREFYRTDSPAKALSLITPTYKDAVHLFTEETVRFLKNKFLPQKTLPADSRQEETAEDSAPEGEEQVIDVEPFRSTGEAE